MSRVARAVVSNAASQSREARGGAAFTRAARSGCADAPTPDSEAPRAHGRHRADHDRIVCRSTMCSSIAANASASRGAPATNLN